MGCEIGNLVPRIDFLKDGTSSDMNINPSGLASFSWGPRINQSVEVLLLHITVIDGVTLSDVSNFMDISGGLSTGCKLKAVIKKENHDILTIKNNGDLMHLFSDGAIIDRGTLTSGLLTNQFVFSGSFLFNVKMDGNQSDSIIMQINDNLSSLNYMKVSVLYKEVI